MIDILIAGSVTIPFLIFPMEWNEDPRIRPWVERFIIAFYTTWVSLLVVDEILRSISSELVSCIQSCTTRLASF